MNTDSNPMWRNVSSRHLRFGRLLTLCLVGAGLFAATCQTCTNVLPNTLPSFGPETVIVGQNGQGILDVHFAATPMDEQLEMIVAGGDVVAGKEAPQSVVVSLNGQVALSNSEWQRTAPLVVKTVPTAIDNHLHAQVSGAPGAQVTILFRRPGPCRSAPFGGWRVERTKGKPKKESREFTLAKRNQQRFTLVVINGTPDGSRVRATSGRVWFNGQEMFSPNDFKQKVPLLCREVVLRDCNRIEVQLEGTPGDEVTVLLVAESTDSNAVDFVDSESSVPESIGRVPVALALARSQACSLPVAIVSTAETATAGVDYIGIGAVAWFPAGSQRIEFSVPIIDDNEVEESETFVLRIASSASKCAIPEREDRDCRGDRNHGRDDDHDSDNNQRHDKPSGKNTNREDCEVGRGGEGKIDEHQSGKGDNKFSKWFQTGSPSSPSRADNGCKFVYETPKSKCKTSSYNGYKSHSERPGQGAQQEENTRRHGHEQRNGAGCHPGDAEWNHCGRHRVTIQDDDLNTTPSVAWSSTTGTIVEGDITVSATLILSAATTGDVRVAFGVSGTATFGSDHQRAPASVIIPAGTMTFDVPVAILEDLRDEEDETVILTITTVTGANVGTITAHTVTIIDDDEPPTVAFQLPESTVGEGDGLAIIPVVLSAPSERAITVAITATGSGLPDDAGPVPTIAVFPPGAISADVVIPIIEDNLDELDEFVQLSLLNPVAAILGTPTIHRLTIIDNDEPPTVTIAPLLQTVGEGEGPAVVRLTLDHVSGRVVTVTLVTEGSAIPGIDTAIVPATVVIAAGETGVDVSIAIIDDALDEADEDLLIQIGNADGALLGANLQARVTILDNDEPPVVTIAPQAQSVDEAAGTATVSLHLDAPSSQAVTVTLGVSGTAAWGVDALEPPTSVVIPAGAQEATVIVTIIDDLLNEPDETLILTATLADAAVIGAANTATITILDNEAKPTVAFAIAASTVDESVGVHPVVVILSSVSGQDVTVPISVSGSAVQPDDFTMAASVVIPAGSTTASLLLAIIDDALDENDESVVLNMGAVTGAIAVNPLQHVVTIRDNDEAPVVSIGPATQTVDEGVVTANLELSLSVASGQAVEVTLGASGSASPSIDVGAIPATITIPAGTTTISLPIAIIDDVLDEDDETLTVTITAASLASIGTADHANIIITDNDEPPLVAFTAASASVDENAGNAAVVLQLSAPSGRRVTVNTTISGSAQAGSDHTFVAGEVVFNPGVVEATVVGVIIDDIIDELDETVIFTLSDPEGAQLGAPQVHTLTIIDNDVPPKIAFQIASSTVAETAGSAEVVVVLDGISSQPITATIQLSGSAEFGADFTAPQTVTVPAGQQEALIGLTLIDDLIHEGNETAVLTLVPAAGADLGVPGTHTVTITDDEALPSVAFAAATSMIGEADGIAQVRVVLNNPDSVTTSVGFSIAGTATNGEDYLLANGVLEFPAGVQQAVIDIPIIDDLLIEDPESVLLTLVNPNGLLIGTPGNHSLTIISDDALQVRPIAESLTDNGDGSVTVFFGYENPGDNPLTIPIGSQNRFLPGSNDRGQIVEFHTGRSPVWPGHPFSVVMPEDELTWFLSGLTDVANRDLTRSPTVPYNPPRSLPPRCTITSPADGTIIPLGTPLTVIIDALDLDGTVVSVDLRDGGTVVASLTPTPGLPLTVTLSELGAGDHVLTARAVDNQNNETISPAVTVTVHVGPSLALVVPTGPLAIGSDLPVTVTATAGDQPIVSVVLRRNGLLIAEETESFVRTFNNAQNPEEVFTATVTDAAGLVARATHVVVVSERPQVAIVSPANGASVQPWKGLVPLLAAASDRDGHVVRVRFLVDGAEVGDATTSPWRFDWAPGVATTAVFTAEATDDVGLTALSAPVAITINAPPTVAITAPLDGSVIQIGDDVTVTAEANDTENNLLALVLLLDEERVAEASEGLVSAPLPTSTPRTINLAAEAYDRSGGYRHSAIVQVRVNAAPVAELLAPLNTLIPDEFSHVELRGRASDVDGTIVSLVFRADGDVVGTITGSEGSVDWVPQRSGIFFLDVLAIDNDGATHTQGHNITVNALPVPVFTFAADTVPVLGRSFDLTASATDSDGSIAAMKLYVDGDSVATSSASSIATLWTPSSAGTATLRVEATDDRGALGGIDRSVDVDIPPVVAVQEPVPSAVLPHDRAVRLSAIASDSDGSIARVDFHAGDLLVASDPTAPYSVDVVLPSGAYAITAVAIDDRNVATRSSPIPVRVNTPPEITLARANAADPLNEGDDLPLIATASDDDGTMVSVSFALDGSNLGNDTSAPFTWTVLALAAGEHTLTATASDSDGATTTATLDVLANSRPRVTLTQPSYGAVLPAGSLVTFTAEAADPDGNIAYVAYLAGKNGAEPTEVNVGLSYPYPAQWVPASAGTWTLVAVAYDTTGASGRSAPVVVTVNAAPTATLAITNSGGAYDPSVGLHLTVEAADSDGSIREVRFLQDDEVFAIDTEAPYAIDWLGAEHQPHRLQAVAVDDLGALGYSNFITIELNAAPTVRILSPLSNQIFQGGAGIIAEAQISDEDSTVAQAVFRLDGADIATLTDQPWRVTLPALDMGEHELTVVATDNGGLSANAGPVVFRINGQPTVSLTEPSAGSIIAQYAPVTLTAAAADPDGSLQGVEFYAGATYLGADTSAPYSITTAFSTSGSRLLRAEAIDDLGARVVSAAVSVTVNAAPLVSLSAPSGGAEFASNEDIVISATAIDTDGSIVSVSFYDGATVLGTVNSAPWQWTLVAAQPGSHAFSAVAIDDRGASTRSAWVAVSVNPPGTNPPDLAILTPTHGSVVLLGNDIPFTIEATDSDGTVQSVVISEGDSVLTTLSAAPWTWTWVNAPAGRHRLSVVATDDAGSTRTISGWTVIVNQPPTATITAPADGAVMVADASATVSVLAADSDGQVVQVALRRDGLVVGSRTSPPYNFTLDTSVSGTSTLIAEVTDDLGTKTNSSAISVTVNAPPTVSVVTPVANQVHRLGQPLLVEVNPADADSGLSAVEIRIDGRLAGTLTAAPWVLSVGSIPLGAHEAQAIAIDSYGLRASSLAVPFRTSAPPVVTPGSPIAGTILNAGTLVTLSAQATDSDGAVAAVHFLVDGEIVATDNSAPFSVPWLVTGSGPRIISMEAVDDTGLVTRSSDIAVTINARPIITVSTPTLGEVLPSATDVAIEVQATDSDGTVAELRVLMDNQPVATVAGSAYSGSVSGLVDGSHTLRVEATDAQGAIAAPVLVRFAVGENNNAPTIAITAPLAGDTVPRGQASEINIDTTDSDGQVVSVRFFADGVDLGSDTDAPFSWLWTPEAIGTVQLTAEAMDDAGRTTLSSAVAVNVAEPSGDALQIIITNPSGPRKLAFGQGLNVQAVVTGAINLDHVEFLIDGVVRASDATDPFQVTLTGLTEGVHQLTARAVDYGRTALSLPIAITVARDNGSPPTVAITDPATEGTTVTLSQLIRGKVTTTNPAADIDRWTLTLREGDNGTPFTIASGRGAIDGSLGVLDATTLRNGSYRLELTGYDTIGYYVSVERRIRIDGQAKVGEFAVSFTDLVVPVAGIPLAMVRTYKSFDRLTQGDFGYGWTYSLTDLQVTLDETRGPAYDTNFEVFSKRSGGSREVTLTMPDTGRRATFTYTLDPVGLVGRLQAHWHAPAGVTASLNAIGNVNVISLFTAPPYWEALGAYNANDFEAFDVPGWILTLADGTRYRLEREDLGLHTYNAPNGAAGVTHAYGQIKLVSITQPSGDVIAISDQAIEHRDPTGALTRSLRFARDAQGRITAVYDPNNQDASGNPNGPAAVTYTYDAAGDLVAVNKLTTIDPDDGSTTYETSQYFYENSLFPHYLTRIVDPNGNPARMEYDVNGRLVALIDGDGNRTELTHDTGAREERISDALGNVRSYRYDIGGNVTSETDALGHTTSRTYDGQGNVLTETDPLGHTTTRTFDSKGNQTSETDALGHTTSWTYDSKGNVLTTTDALGRVTTNTYDAAGHILSVTDAMGFVTTYTYSAAGNLETETDALGNVTTYAFDGKGNMTQLTDALGNVTTFTFDANGNQTSQRQTRTNIDGTTQTIETKLGYDAQGRVSTLMDALGNISRTRYTLAGDVGAVTDALGRTTSYRYDNRGQLIRIEHADGTLETTLYNTAGQRTQATDRAGRVSRFTYDANGQMIALVAPDGTTSQTKYDAAGRVTRTIGPDGAETHFTYDAVGRQISVTNAAGHTVSYEYDALGQVTSSRNANGVATTMHYDALGRQLSTLFDDGTSVSTTYDALGRRTESTDQLGHTTEFGYDALSRLVTVTDAAGQVTSYGYDEVGNQMTQEDALGRVTRYDYDMAGRRLLRRLPLGMQETMQYDVIGRLVDHTDFNGFTTSRTYDIVNRLTAIIPDAAKSEPTVAYTYLSDGRRETMTDALGTTSYGYDAVGRLTTKATPIGTLEYSYDAIGRLQMTRSDLATSLAPNVGAPATTIYQYDAAGRLAGVQGVGVGTTEYSYLATGNLASVRLANGVTTSYQFDRLDRLTDLVSVDGNGSPLVSYGYQLRANGHRSRVTELSGRRVDYTYDVLDRLLSETIANAVGGSPVGSIHYTMDQVGNRLTRTSSVTGVSNQTLGYDANDRLNSTPYTYDANGNTLTSPGVTNNADTYTFHDRLTHRVGDDGVVIDIIYDGDGNKVGERVAGVTTWFLIDTMNPTGYAQTFEERIGAWTVDGLTNVTVKRSYTLGLDVIAQQDEQHNVRHFGYDGHGSLRYLTNSIGEVTDTFDYDAYGVVIHRTGVTECRYGYAGEEVVGSLGLGYNRARMYSYIIGAFTSFDSFEGDMLNPKTHHKYLYAQASPVDMIDPSGNFGIAYIYAQAAFTQTLARAYNSRAFVTGGVLLSRYYQAIGKLAERLGGSIAEFVGARAITNGARIGQSVIDWSFKIGRSRVFMEVKYSIPSSNSALTRLSNQMISMSNEIIRLGGQDQARALVWSLTTPTGAQMTAVYNRVGPEVFNRIQFVSGVNGLITYLGKFF